MASSKLTQRKLTKAEFRRFIFTQTLSKPTQASVHRGRFKCQQKSNNIKEGIFICLHSNSQQLRGCFSRRENVPRSRRAIAPERLGFYLKYVSSIKEGLHTIFSEFSGPPEKLLSIQMHRSKLCSLVSYFEEEPHWKGSAQSTTVSSNCIREIETQTPSQISRQKSRPVEEWDLSNFNGDLTRIKVSGSQFFLSYRFVNFVHFHSY